MTTTISLMTKEFRARWVSLAIFCGLGAALVLMYTALFPSIKQQSAQLAAVMQSMGPTLKAMGIQNLGFDSLASFLSLEYFSIMWPLLAILLVVGWAGGMIAGEIDQGTMGLLLSLPLGRSRIYLTKFLVTSLALAVFTIITVGIIIPLAALFNQTVSISHILHGLIMGFLFGWAFLSLGFLISAAASDRGRVSLGIGALAILMYVATAVAGLKDNLDWLKKLSFFSYLDAQNVIVKGEWHWHSVAVFLVIVAVATILGLVIFNRRDIAV